jgi:succinate dehydrogenase / fumarate reductase cytochrome b subunit
MRPDPRAILTLKFGAEAEHPCNCSGRTCPRRYLVWSGFALGGFLLLHLALNSLAWWPEKFQAASNRIHSLGAALPMLEVGLVFIPLAVHIAFGLRTLCREKLRFGVEKHHHGSDLRQWLQRLTALILLVFIAFHIVTLHRWFGGRFDPLDALGSASRAIRQFWRGLPAGHPGNLLFAQFYLLGIAAAVYHLANGIATGAEVLGWVSTPGSQQRLWRISVIASSALLLASLAAWLALTRKAVF